MLTPTQTPSQLQTLTTTNSTPTPIVTKAGNNFKEKFIPVFDSYPFPKLNTNLNPNPYTNSTPTRDQSLAPTPAKETTQTPTQT